MSYYLINYRKKSHVAVMDSLYSLHCVIGIAKLVKKSMIWKWGWNIYYILLNRIVEVVDLQSQE